MGFVGPETIINRFSKLADCELQFCGLGEIGSFVQQNQAFKI